MKRTLKLLTICALLAAPASAQFIGYQSPQGVVATPISGAIAPTASSAIKNLGQTVHFLTYTQVGASGQVQIRLEGSYDNSTWFPISDDATDISQGQVLAIGYYPFVRANLLKCTGCAGGGVTANYSGVSSSPGNPFGFYNPSQQIRKTLFVAASPGTTASSSTVAAPYGSTAGVVVLLISGGLAAGSTIQILGQTGNLSTTYLTITPNIGTTIQMFPVAAIAASQVSATFNSAGAGAGTYSLYYFFYPPGAAQPYGAQPSATSNSEATAVNATVTTTLTATGLSRGHLFSATGHCSAGTAQLAVKDGATTIWTSGAADVGTTSFTRAWNPGLASSPGSNLVVTLSACGAANTGTLDVQGSVF